MAVSCVRTRGPSGRRAARLGLAPVPAVREVGHGDPAAAVLLGWVTGGLALAAWLHRQGHRSMCSQIRRPWGLLALSAFLGHLARLLGPYDPFDFLSSKIPLKH